MATTIRTPRSESKAANARHIFAAMANFPRATVIGRFKAELGLTEAAASTYYQTCRREHGLTHPRPRKSAVDANGVLGHQ